MAGRLRSLLAYPPGSGERDLLTNPGDRFSENFRRGPRDPARFFIWKSDFPIAIIPAKLEKLFVSGLLGLVGIGRKRLVVYFPDSNIFFNIGRPICR